MKKILLLCVAALLCTSLVACGKQSAARAERSKPRISITTANLLLSRAPAANAQIDPDGTLRIDDIVVPQPDAERAKLQLLFGHLQMLRQQALETAKPDPTYAAIPVQSTPQIDALKDELLQEIPPLRDYRDSFGNLKAERR